MRTRSSLEDAFLRYRPPPKAQSKPIPLSPVDREPVDLVGCGTPYGWSDWYHDGSQYGVTCRVLLWEGNSIQFKNGSEKAVKIQADHGSTHFQLMLNPGQSRDLNASGDEAWH
jgi:hypothetical protein